MRKIVVNEEFATTPSVMWKLFTNIDQYPKYVQFVTSVQVISAVKEGGKWYDISTILWFPMKYTHHITKFIPEKEIEYVIYPVVGGKIVQSYFFHEEKKMVRITGAFTVDFPWIVDILLGAIVEKRIEQMLRGTIKNVHQWLKTA